jgi:hypothetical protein
MTATEQQTIDTSVHKWDDVLAYMESGGDKTYGFLQLAESDLGAVAEKIACPYCRKQIVAEVKIIDITLRFSRLANEWEASGGIRNRLGLVGRAVPLIVNLTYLELTKIL